MRKRTERITLADSCEKCGAPFLMDAPQVVAVRVLAAWKESHYCNAQWWDSSPGERKHLPQPQPGQRFQDYSHKYFSGGKPQNGEAKKRKRKGRGISVGRRRRAAISNPVG